MKNNVLTIIVILQVYVKSGVFGIADAIYVNQIAILWFNWSKCWSYKLLSDFQNIDIYVWRPICYFFI